LIFAGAQTWTVRASIAFDRISKEMAPTNSREAAGNLIT
jgi:hypothetical protein